MAQVSWRADDDVVDRARRAAAGRGHSLNAYLTLVVEAATDPALGGSAVDALRERLHAAGLLEKGVAPEGRRPSADAVAAAGARAAAGTSLAELVTANR